jgi:hypothetical protein
MESPEKRAHKRTPVALPVRVRAGEAEMDGTIDNLGALGALISTANLEALLEVGGAVQLSIETADGRVDVDGVILRIDQEFTGGDIRRTIAVRFGREIAT